MYIEQNKKDNELELKSKEWKISNSLFSSQELIFFNELKNYLNGKKVLIFSKVRLIDLIKTKHYIKNKDNYNLIVSETIDKHIDYVLTDYNGKILCLIELDGNSHLKPITIKNDEFKNTFFESINIPLKRFKNYEYHNLKVLDKYILQN